MIDGQWYPHGRVELDEREVSFTMIRAQGAGGQNVNKVSSAVHLRFDIPASSLPEPVKAALLALKDQRVTKEGVIVIKAQGSRSQEQNRLDALARLRELIQSVSVASRPRKATKPTFGSQQRRLASKTARSQIKRLRGKADE